MNAKDLEDISLVIYWLSATRTNIEGIGRDPALCTTEELATDALRCLKNADDAVERIALGKNRIPRGAH